jgi:ribonuclease D
MKSVYDQLLLVEALGFEERGLDSILQRVLGITVRSKKKYQQYNWTLRPIGDDAMQYALSDVRYLFELNTRLLQMIKDRDRYEELIERFVKNDFDSTKKSVPPIFKSLGFRKLTGSQKARCEKLVATREIIAEKLDWPPHFVLPHDKVIMLAADPEYLNTAEFDKGINGRIVDMLKRKLREAL